MTSLPALAVAAILGLFVGNAALVTRVHSRGAMAVGWRLASWWIVIAATLFIITGHAGLKLRAIGLAAPGLASLGWGMALFVVAFLLSGILARLLMPALGLAQDGGQAARIAALPIPIQLALFITAAAVEELVCRGVIIASLAPVSPTLAVAASVLVFALPHLFAWKPAQLAFVTPLGLVFALFFLWRFDLAACILAHFLVDAAGFLLMRLPR